MLRTTLIFQPVFLFLQASVTIVSVFLFFCFLFSFFFFSDFNYTVKQINGLLNHRPESLLKHQNVRHSADVLIFFFFPFQMVVFNTRHFSFLLKGSLPKTGHFSNKECSIGRGGVGACSFFFLGGGGGGVRHFWIELEVRPQSQVAYHVWLLWSHTRLFVRWALACGFVWLPGELLFRWWRGPYKLCSWGSFKANPHNGLSLVGYWNQVFDPRLSTHHLFCRVDSRSRTVTVSDYWAVRQMAEGTPW